MNQNHDCTIFIIDDDEAVRRGISLLLISFGYQVITFENPHDFLAMDSEEGPGCILLDIFLGNTSGLDLQDNIRRKFPNIPVIYISGHGDIPMSVTALKKGALNFLEKPVIDEQLLTAVNEALKLSMNLVKDQQERQAVKARINTLTQREFEIFRYILKGMLNKQIAAELNIAEHTVKLHRGNITEKLGVKSVAEMVYMAEKMAVK